MKVSLLEIVPSRRITDARIEHAPLATVEAPERIEAIVPGTTVRAEPANLVHVDVHRNASGERNALFALRATTRGEGSLDVVIGTLHAKTPLEVTGTCVANHEPLDAGTDADPDVSAPDAGDAATD